MDQNVQDGVGRWLERQGYDVLYVRSILSADSPDELIAFVTNTEGLVLISHDRDFAQFARLLPVGFRRGFQAGSGRILLRVNEAHAVKRLEEEWDGILFHHTDAVRRNRRFLVEVNNTGIRVVSNAPVGE